MLGKRFRLTMLLVMGLFLISSVVIIVSGCNNPTQEEELDPTARIWDEIVPVEGTATGYGLPLSLDNTQQFIDWYHSIALSAEEQATRDMALSPLAAPCCHDYPMSTCCCECNLARSVWGLSAYLITEKGYGEDLVQEAASQWLHFIRPDFYVGRAIEEEGGDPGQRGFIMEDSCFAGRCDRPFYTETSSSHLGGCGGMKELIQLEAN